MTKTWSCLHDARRQAQQRIALLMGERLVGSVGAAQVDALRNWPEALMPTPSAARWIVGAPAIDEV